MAYIGSNIKVELQKTKSAAITVTNISKAAEAVVTASNSLSNGDVVYFEVSAGMVELDGQACRVKSVSGTEFTLEGVNSTSYSTYSAVTCYEVATWETLASAQSIAMPNPAATKIDLTTLLDVVKKYTFGLPDAPDGTITGLFAPGAAAEALITAATNTNSRMVCRCTFQGVAVSVFNAYWSGGAGFDASPNAALTSTISFTPVGKVIHYAS